jgi:predicted nucleotidyltransferase
MPYRSVPQGFAVFLNRLRPTATQTAAKARHRASVEASLRNALDVSRFRELGSFTPGTGIKDYSDVDLLVSLKSKPAASDTALAWVKTALSNSFPTTTVRVSRPAVVVEFAGGAETWEVIPGFLTGRGGDDVFVYDIPGPNSGWIDTAPEEHINYVKEINSTASIKDGAKSLARYVKAWKYFNNVPISSFYLEMRAAQYMDQQASVLAPFDICGLLENLEGHQLASMNDPKKAAGRFDACSSPSKKTEALSKLHTGATRARKAYDAWTVDDAESFRYFDLLFNDHFPSRYYS